MGRNRTVTDEERAQWAERNAAWARERNAQAWQARLDLLAAIEERDAAERAVQAALVAALELNPSDAIRPLTGWKEATFWRRVRAAREVEQA